MTAIEPRAHENRILGGAPVAGGDGRFEVRAARDGASLGTWPRSGVDALQGVLGALAGARDALAALDGPARLQRAAAALAALGGDEALAAWLAARLDVVAAELAPHRADLADRGAPHLDGADAAGGRPPAAGGLALAIPDWSELLLGTAVAPLGELVAGRPVLVLGDPRTPAVADALLAACESAGFPPGSAAVLHGVDATLLRAAVRSPAVVRAVVSGPPERLQAVHAAAAARPSHAPLELLEDVPRGVSLALGRDAPERVSEIVERAFGRARTLSGQLPGRVEAVRCDPRAFSAFTEALLAELAVDPDAASPVPLIDRRALAALQEVSGRGLDEGATLIHGGVTRGGPGPMGGDPPGTPPIVFTNVEEGMQLYALPAPGPLLRLVRGG
jgi:acyl-CoA reductase-like NAD-dependent aldehyde dehydrogenase